MELRPHPGGERSWVVPRSKRCSSATEELERRNWKRGAQGSGHRRESARRRRRKQATGGVQRNWQTPNRRTGRSLADRNNCAPATAVQRPPNEEAPRKSLRRGAGELRRRATPAPPRLMGAVARRAVVNRLEAAACTVTHLIAMSTSVS